MTADGGDARRLEVGRFDKGVPDRKLVGLARSFNFRGRS